MTALLGQWAYALLAFNRLLQYIILTICVIGCGLSIYAALDCTRSHVTLAKHHINGIRIGLVRSHLVVHLAIMLSQIGLILSALMVLTLPDIPLAMYRSEEEGAWVVVVIVFRRLMHATVGLMLLGATVYKVRWLRQSGIME